MKRLRFFTTLIAIVLIVACTNGQNRKTVYGNGKVVTKERQAGSFDGLRVSTGIDVYLRQGDKESISVESDENLQEYIITEIQGGVLHVYSEANIRDSKEKKVYVTMKDIKSVKASSAGDITGESPIRTKDIEIDVSSAGDIRLDVTADKINADISSSGDLSLKGKADILEADLSSAGDLNAYDLEVREANVSVSSAGDADINVSEKLTARASSAGDINYSGNPKYIDAHSSSAGGVHKK